MIIAQADAEINHEDEADFETKIKEESIAEVEAEELA